MLNSQSSADSPQILWPRTDWRLSRSSGWGHRWLFPCAEVLATMKTVPQIAILGNHDHWNNANIVEGALQARGITVLRNRSLPLERGKSRIWISGIDDAVARAADLALTLKSVPATEA